MGLVEVAIIIISAGLLFINGVVLYEVTECDKSSSWHRKLALGYMGIATGIPWAICACVVVVIILSIPEGGLDLVWLEETIGLNPANMGMLIVFGILVGSFNSVTLAVVNECQTKQNHKSNFWTAVVVQCLTLLLLVAIFGLHVEHVVKEVRGTESTSHLTQLRSATAQLHSGYVRVARYAAQGAPMRFVVEE